MEPLLGQGLGSALVEAAEEFLGEVERLPLVGTHCVLGEVQPGEAGSDAFEVGVGGHAGLLVVKTSWPVSSVCS